MYDFIGDIHGYADKLEALLLKMGYMNDSGVYRHPERKVFFLGDYIDRGPEIKKTVSMVRKMTEARTELDAANVCCLDYSVAKNGSFVSYGWNGEREMQQGNFVSV